MNSFSLGLSAIGAPRVGNSASVTLSAVLMGAALSGFSSGLARSEVGEERSLEVRPAKASTFAGAAGAATAATFLALGVMTLTTFSFLGATGAGVDLLRYGSSTSLATFCASDF